MLLFVVTALNLVWLGTSTVKIENASKSPIESIAFSACDETHAVGDLKPDESIFRFLEACGDDTLAILIGESRFCQIYVEGELYHVDATISAADSVDCEYDDLLSSLFIVKALW